MKFVIYIFLYINAVSCALFQEVRTIRKTHLDGRIIGGEEANPGQFPWQVAIYLDRPDGSFFCCGALIHPRWVLTAGHCTFKATIYTLHLGSHTLVDYDSNRIEYTVTRSVTHPDYDPDTLQNDLGLIRIETPVQTNDFIKIIPLATILLGANIPVTVSGWGATGNWDGAVNHLNYVELSSITNADCQGVYGQFVTSGMVCAVGKTTEGTCSGDSGGPLVTIDNNGYAVHVGLVSWSSSSGCDTDHPSGYTRTASYIGWINSTINQKIVVCD